MSYTTFDLGVMNAQQIGDKLRYAGHTPEIMAGSLAKSVVNTGGVLTLGGMLSFTLTSADVTGGAAAEDLTFTLREGIGTLGAPAAVLAFPCNVTFEVIEADPHDVSLGADTYYDWDTTPAAGAPVKIDEALGHVTRANPKITIAIPVGTGVVTERLLRVSAAGAAQVTNAAEATVTVIARVDAVSPHISWANRLYMINFT